MVPEFVSRRGGYELLLEAATDDAGTYLPNAGSAARLAARATGDWLLDWLGDSGESDERVEAAWAMIAGMNEAAERLRADLTHQRS